MSIYNDKLLLSGSDKRRAKTFWIVKKEFTRHCRTPVSDAGRRVGVHHVPVQTADGVRDLKADYMGGCS